MPQDSREPADIQRDARDTPPPMPKWVKYLLIVLALVALAVVITLGAGGHSPRQHGAAELREYRAQATYVASTLA